MATTGKLMTADELLRLPRGRERHELIAGELRTMPLHETTHGLVAARLNLLLDDSVRTRRLGVVFLGGTGFLLARQPDTVRAPDAAFVCRERALEVGEPAGYWPGAPDLAIEVISPTDLYTEVEEKVAAWLEHGARMVLVANPRRHTVAVHRPDQLVRILTDDDVLDGEDVVPGWTLPVRAIFIRGRT